MSLHRAQEASSHLTLEQHFLHEATDEDFQKQSRLGHVPLAKRQASSVPQIKYGRKAYGWSSVFMAEDNQRAEGTVGLAALPVQSAPASWAQFPHQSAAINTSSPRPDKGRAGSPPRADFSAGVSMESFVYPPFSTYQSFRAGLTPHGGRDPVLKQPSWKQSKSTGLGPFPGTPTPLPSDYLDSCHRAHLKALLSQVSPGLTPRLRRANTREIGVQVNPRADAAVQCSLGPRTLPAGRPLSPAGLYARGRMALYSPVLDRRLFTMPEAAGFREKDEVAAASPEKQKAEDGGRKQQDGQAAATPLTEGQSKASQEEAAAPSRQAAFQVCSGAHPSLCLGSAPFTAPLASRPEPPGCGGGWWCEGSWAWGLLSDPNLPTVLGAEVRLLPLQRLQDQMGECLCVVHFWK